MSFNKCLALKLVNCFNISGCVQLGQLSVIPPGLVLEAGGDFNLAGSYACKVEVPPPLQGSKWGGLQLSRHDCLLS